MKDEKKYTFSDIIDFILMLGGWGIGGFLLFIMLAQPRFSIPKPFVFFDLILLFLGTIGGTRMLLRQKQDRIEELESLLPSTTPNYMLQSPPQTTPQTNLHSLQTTAPVTRISSYEAELEVRFLEALMQKKGRISLVEAVILVRESIDKLLPIIEKLQSKGIIGTEIEPSGQIMYVSS